MSTLVENESAHDGDCREITSTDPCLVSDSEPRFTATNISVQLSQKDLSSDSSFDSSEDKVPPPTLSKKRKNFKLRSISDSIDNEQNTGPKTGSRYPFQRGILKVSNYKDRLRSLSESCVENYSFSQGSNSGLDDWLKEEEIEEEDENGGDKVKKTVRFSDTVKRQLFRSNSSILGQRKKNQRKQKKKTKKKDEPSTSLSSSTESVNAAYVAQMSESLDHVSLSDSGIEVEDSDPAEGSTPQLDDNKSTKTKNKKTKKSKTRLRSASESSELIFDIDL